MSEQANLPPDHPVQLLANPETPRHAISRTLFEVDDLEGALRSADQLAKSSLLPKHFAGQPANVLIAVEWGKLLGVGPLTALTSIAVVNGRPSIWGDLGKALVLARRGIDLVEFKMWSEPDGPTDSPEELVGLCRIERTNETPGAKPLVGDGRFSFQDAKRADLLGKDTYQNHLRTMLKWRAFWRAARDVYADLFCGLSAAEEQEEVVHRASQVTVKDTPNPQMAGAEALAQTLGATPSGDPERPSPSSSISPPGDEGHEAAREDAVEPHERGETVIAAEEVLTTLVDTRPPGAPTELFNLDQAWQWLDQEVRWAFPGSSGFADLDEANASIVLSVVKAGRRVANTGFSTKADVARELRRIAVQVAGFSTDDLAEIAKENEIPWSGGDIEVLKAEELRHFLDAVRAEVDSADPGMPRVK